MRMRVLAITASAVLASLAFAQRVVPAQIDATIARQMERYKVPGLGFALIVNGKVAFRKGYGVRDLGTRAPVNPDTVFPVASISKPITSLAVMRQVAAGKLSLDAPVSRYLPGLKFSDPVQGSKVTLRQVLSHSSGLARFDGWVFDLSVDSPQKVLETVANNPFASAPGSAFEYNNQNFSMAAAVLEKVTGQSWEQNVRQSVLAPLGMTRSQFTYTEALKAGNVASPYAYTARGVGRVADYDKIGSDSRFRAIGPAGGVLASTNDLVRFMQFQLSGGGSLLSKRWLEESHKLQIAAGHAYDPDRARSLNDIRGYGLGWYLGEYRGLKGFAHGGNIHGFSSMIFALPEQGFGMVMLANLTNANDFLDSTRLMLIEQLFDLQPRTDFSRSPVAAQVEAMTKAPNFRPDPGVLRRLSGRYAVVGGGSLELSLEDGTLFLSQFGARFPLTPFSDEIYLAEFQGLTLFIQAQIDPGGTVWIRQDGQLAAVKAPGSTAGRTLTDPQNRFSTALPEGLEVVRSTPEFTLAQFKQPPATFVFAVSTSKGSLEETVSAFLKSVDPALQLKQAQTSSLPPVNGVAWTQLLYMLPNSQVLAVFAAQRGSSVYLFGARGDQKDAPAFSAVFEQILSGYKFP